MSDETPKKPSELIGGRATELAKQDKDTGFLPYYDSPEAIRVINLIGGLPPPNWSPDRQFGFTLLAVSEYLDAEAERRSAWEATVEKHLADRATIQALVHFRNATIRAFPGLLPLIAEEIRAEGYEVRHVYAGSAPAGKPPAGFKVDADEPEVKP